MAGKNHTHLDEISRQMERYMYIGYRQLDEEKEEQETNRWKQIL